MPDPMRLPRTRMGEPSPEEVAAFAAAFTRDLPGAVARYGVEGAACEAILMPSGSVRISLSAADGFEGREVIVSGEADRFAFLRGAWDGEKRVDGHAASDLAARIRLAAERTNWKLQKQPPSSAGRRAIAGTETTARLRLLAVAATSACGHPGATSSLHAARSDCGGNCWDEISIVVPDTGAFPVLIEVHARPLYRVAVMEGGTTIHESTYDDAGFATGFAAFYWHYDRHGPIGSVDPAPRSVRRMQRAGSGSSLAQAPLAA